MKYKKDSWNLSNIKPKDIDASYKQMEDLTNKLESYKPFFKNISKENFHHVLRLDNELDILIDRIAIATTLKLSENSMDPVFNQQRARLRNYTTDLANRLLFIPKAIKQMPKERLEYLSDGLTQDQKYSLNETRKYKKYMLPLKVEQIINLKNSTGKSTLIQLYNKLTSSFKYPWKTDGKRKKISDAELTSFFINVDRKKREEAYRKQHKKYNEFAGIIGDIYIGLVKDWGNDVKTRGFKSPINKRNVSNKISDQAVENLLTVTRENRFLFQDYFKLKKELCGIKGKMRRTDVYAPTKISNHKKIPFSEAVQIVLDNFENFSPEYKEMAEKMFKERHVYSIESKNKKGGAYCMGVPPGFLPYVFMNYYGNLTDVSTLAHELGHAIHDQLALAEHDNNTYHPSLPLAETASVFSERLLIEKLISETDDKEVKKHLLVESLNNSFATVLRQTYFVQFEKDAHELINSPQGTNYNELSDLYLANLKEQFGDSLLIQKHFKNEWLRIPHIFHTPFYCYAYSVGNLLTLALVEEYKKEGKAFVSKHKRILAAGGSDSPENILKREGIDITQKSFWQKGFDIIKKDVQSLEKLI